MTDRHIDGLTSECKNQCGLDVDEVAAMTGIPRRTLYNWWKTKRKLMKIILAGVASETQFLQKK